MNKRGAIPLLVLAIVGVLLATSFSLISLGTITGFDSSGVYVSEYGNLHCREDSSEQNVVKYADQDYTFNCGSDYTVDNCEVNIECTGSSIFGCSGYYLKNGAKGYYELRGGGVNSFKISSGDAIKFYSSVININEDNTKITYRFNPYRLWIEERGGMFIASSSDCSLANQRTLDKQNFEYGDWDTLNKDEYRNYFLGWNKLYGSKVYDEGICLNNALYKIDEIRLADGEEINVQGNKIRNVECCPHTDNNCGDDFEFKQAEQERECSYDYQCANAGNPYDNLFSSTTAKVEECISGQCTEKDIQVECDSDSKCRQLYGDGYGCDLSNDNYGKCIEVGKIAQARCGDLICQTGETKADCPSDCMLDCPEGFKLITTKSSEGSLCFFGKGLCEDKVEYSCKKDVPNYFLYILIGVAIILLIVFRNKVFAVIRAILNKFGVRL